VCPGTVSWYGVWYIGDDRYGKIDIVQQNLDDEVGIFLLGDGFGV
jgi:hypothetical protein